MEQSCKWTGYGVEIEDEMVLEISKSQETLDLFHSGGSWPVTDDVHLPLVHGNAMLTDICTQGIASQTDGTDGTLP